MIISRNIAKQIRESKRREAIKKLIPPKIPPKNIPLQKIGNNIFFVPTIRQNPLVSPQSLFFRRDLFFI